MQLQQQSDQLAKLLKQGEEQTKQLEGQLVKQGEEQKKQLEAKLQQLSEVIMQEQKFRLLLIHATALNQMGAMWIKNKSKFLIHKTEHRLGKQIRS